MYQLLLYKAEKLLERISIEDIEETFDYRLKEITNSDDLNQVID